MWSGAVATGSDVHTPAWYLAIYSAGGILSLVVQVVGGLVVVAGTLRAARMLQVGLCVAV